MSSFVPSARHDVLPRRSYYRTPLDYENQAYYPAWSSIGRTLVAHELGPLKTDPQMVGHDELKNPTILRKKK